MKWVSYDYHEGDQRTHKFFALLPVSIKTNETTETRWLETVCVRQQFIVEEYTDCSYGSSIRSYWKNLAFL